VNWENKKNNLEEERNKIPISESAELFLTPTTVRYRVFKKNDNYHLKGLTKKSAGA
jgi:hypothetical protein